MLLSCKNLQKSYGVEIILEDVSFILEEREKAAIVGVNGAGKTTLMRMLNGEIPPDSGVYSQQPDIRIGYLPQEEELDSDNSIYVELLRVFDDIIAMEHAMRELEVRMAALTGDELQTAMNEYDKLTQNFERRNGYEYKSRLRGVLKGLGFGEEEWNAPIRRLSGGQKTRVAMGKLLLAAPDLLLLDEPTNHLDIDSITWLEDYLKSYSGAIIIISHDRFFLDRVVSKIIEIENKRTEIYKGNYTFYAKHKAVTREAALKRYLDQQREIRRQEEIITRLRSFNREKSIKQAESKAKRLQMMDKIEKPDSSPGNMRILLRPKYESGNDVLDVMDLAKIFPRLTLFENVNISLKKGDKAALIGSNGIGKTTLLKMILGELPSERGKILRGVNVRVGYYDQEHEDLNFEKTIFDEISDTYPRLISGAIRNVLAAFMFTGDDVFKPVSVLSGGEKGRVALAKIMLGGANFLILDEPTNHLDMTSKEILEEALRNFSGTILYVSHDRYFINNTATKIFELSRNGVRMYLGNYDAYMEKRPSPSNEKPSGGRGDYQKRAEDESNARKRKNLLNRVERDIEETESALNKLEAKLMSDEIASNAELADQYFNKKNEVETVLLRLYAEWENQLGGENGNL
jgi:ATP-binding cassette subfamily F protein 3